MEAKSIVDYVTQGYQTSIEKSIKCGECGQVSSNTE